MNSDPLLQLIRTEDLETEYRLEEYNNTKLGNPLYFADDDLDETNFKRARSAAYPVQPQVLTSPAIAAFHAGLK